MAEPNGPTPYPVPEPRVAYGAMVYGPPAAQERSLRELVRRVARRRALLATVFVAVVALVTAYVFMVSPRYASVARLRIDTKTPDALGLANQVSSVPGAGLLGLGRDELETEIGVLRSDRVIDATIDSLALGVVVDKPAESRARILSARTVDPAMDVDGKLTLSQQTPGHYAIEKSGLEEVRNLPPAIAAGDSIRVGGAEITLSPDLSRGGPSPIVIRILPRYKVHKVLDKRLSISQQEGGSRLVEVSYEDRDRTLAAQVVAHVIGEYVRYTNRTEMSSDTTTVSELRRQVDSTARRLAVAEQVLRGFEEQQRLIAPEEQATEQVKRISAISARVDQVSVERNALAQLLDIIQQNAKGGENPNAYRQLATFPSLITNRAIQDLLQTLVDLENKRAELSVRRTTANPEYRELDNRIGEIERQLYQLGPQYLQSLDEELAVTGKTVTALTDTLQAMPAAAMQYGRLLRDRTLLETTYLALQKELKQAELKDVLRQDRIHVVDAPRVANARDPAFPKKAVMLILGVVLAASLAITMALVLELWQQPDVPVLPTL